VGCSNIEFHRWTKPGILDKTWHFFVPFSFISYSVVLEYYIKMKGSLKPQEDVGNHNIFICHVQTPKSNIIQP